MVDVLTTLLSIKMVDFKNFYLVFILFLFSFKNCNNDTNNEDNKFEPQINHLTTIENDWKRDEYGCLRLRTLELANELINKYNLLNSSTDSFKSVFGEPHKTYINKNKLTYIYIIEAYCIDGSPVYDSDVCWIQFEFINNKLIDIPDVFACE